MISVGNTEALLQSLLKASYVITIFIPPTNMCIPVASKIILMDYWTIRCMTILRVFCRRRSACYGLAITVVTCTKSVHDSVLHLKN
jgi:hypothetical protein